MLLRGLAPCLKLQSVENQVTRAKQNQMSYSRALALCEILTSRRFWSTVPTSRAFKGPLQVPIEGFYLDFSGPVPFLIKNNVCCLKILFFWLLDAKPCRTIMKLPLKVSFGPEACEIGSKVGILTCPDLPRSVQEDKSLSAKRAFLFSQKLNFQFLLAISWCVIKSYLSSSKFMPKCGLNN